MYGPTHQAYTPLLSSDGQNLPLDNYLIIVRWSENLQSPISANRNVQDNAIHRIPQLPLKLELDAPPTLQETIEAIAHLPCCKTAGVDGIQPVIWKFVGPMLQAKLYDLFVCYWKQGKLPHDFRDAIIIILYKNKLSWNQPTLHCG